MNYVNKKKWKIEALRFFLAISIALTHFRMYSNDLPFGGMYFVVDFFFIISGYFLYLYWIKNKNEKNILLQIMNYGKKRYLKLLLPFLSAYAVSLLVKIIIVKETMYPDIWAYIREAFMIEISCMPIQYRVNPPGWYCGYLIIGSIFLFAVLLCLDKIKVKRNYFVYWGVGLAIYIYLSMTKHCLNLYPRYEGIFAVDAFLRTVAGLMIGCGCAVAEQEGVLERIKQKTTGIVKNMKQIIDILLLLFFLYMTYWDSGYRKTDWILIPIVWYIFMFVILKPSNVPTIIENLAIFAGKVSMDIFLLHYAIVRIYSKYKLFIGYDWKIVCCIFLVSVLLVAVVYHVVYEWICKLFLKLRG